MLHQIIEPPILKKDIRQAIRLMRMKDEVDMLVFDSNTFYYQLSSGRKVSGSMPRSELPPLLRRGNWFHNRWCEYWISKFRKAFPDCEIIRDDSLGSHGIAKEALLSKGDLSDVLPDFLVIFPERAPHRRITVAFEIERTRKSNLRIHEKLKKYLDETRIDGLVYVCDNARLAETIRMLYVEKLQARSQRTKHYGSNFFLFSDSMSAGPDPLSRLYNANAQKVSLENWCHTLRTTKPENRNDSKFKDA